MSANPNTETTVAVGEAWTAGDATAPADGLNMAGGPTREAFQPGVNTPLISNIGWRRMIRRMKQARQI